MSTDEVSNEWNERLHALAHEYIEQFGDPWSGAGYSTGGNDFLIMAEHAYCVELGRFRERLPSYQYDPPSSGFHLYRLWAEDGRLLYVGVSTRLRERLRSHVRRWGDLIANVTWEEHEDARSMLAAEREAVREEDPALNKALIG